MPTLRNRALDYIVPGLPGYLQGFGPIVVSPSGRPDRYRWRCYNTPFIRPSWKEYDEAGAMRAAQQTLLADFVRAYGSSFVERLEGRCDDVMLLDLEIMHLEIVHQAALKARQLAEHKKRQAAAGLPLLDRRRRTHA